MNLESTVSKIKTKMVLVTPHKANSWLKSNTKNREVREKHVDRLSSDMESGRWMITHQGVAFNCDGTLLDGQHRLMAIVKSGTSQWMCVTNGLPAASVSAIDDHQKRSVGDSLKIVHDVSTPGINRACAAAAWLAFGVGVATAPMRVSRQQQVQSYLEHEKALNWAVAAYPTSKSGLGRAVVLAVIARAYYSAPRTKLEQFCKVLMDPSTSTGAKADKTIIRLRDFLMQAPSGGSSTQRAAFCKTERALRSWLDGEALSKIYEASEELFPTPAEKAAR